MWVSAFFVGEMYICGIFALFIHFLKKYLYIQKKYAIIHFDGAVS